MATDCQAPARHGSVISLAIMAIYPLTEAGYRQIVSETVERRIARLAVASGAQAAEDNRRAPDDTLVIAVEKSPATSTGCTSRSYR
jgi:hypothetical protein